LKTNTILIVVGLMVGIAYASQTTDPVRRTSTDPKMKAAFDAAFRKSVLAPVGSDLDKIFRERIGPRMVSNDNGEAARLSSGELSPSSEMTYIRVIFYDKPDAGGNILGRQWGNELKKYIKPALNFYFKAPVGSRSVVITWIVIRGDKSWYVSCTLNPDAWNITTTPPAEVPNQRRTSITPEAKTAFEAAFAKSIPAPVGSDLDKVVKDPEEVHGCISDLIEGARLSTGLLRPFPEAVFLRLAFYDKPDGKGTLQETQWGNKVGTHSKACIVFDYQAPVGSQSIVMHWIVMRSGKYWYLSYAFNRVIVN
jgi:hypothetical protein